MPGAMARLRATMRSLRGDLSSAPVPDAASPLVDMLGALASALLASSQATNDVEDTLRELARVYGHPKLNVFVLPTLVMIEDAGAHSRGSAIFPVQQTALWLDQAGAIDALRRRCLTSAPPPEDVVREIAEIVSSRPRFSPLLTVVGHALLTVGFGMVLNPTLTALPVYVILGSVVGIIVAIGTRLPTLALLLPVATAFIVTVLVSVVIRPIVHDDSLRLVAPALVSFLPGLTLTIAAVELTSGQMMAGASRLVYGFARLGLLAFGVFAGLSVSRGSTTTASSAEQLGAWAPWVGILLVAIGYYFFSSAPKRSLPWILYALVLAYAGQLLGNVVLGAQLSGLVGALIVIPGVYLVGHLSSSPPPAIMLTCAYWLLVPGSMGFIGMSEAASGTAGATAVIVQTLGSLVAIATGMIIGAGLSRDVSRVARAWRGSDGGIAPG